MRSLIALKESKSNESLITDIIWEYFDLDFLTEALVLAKLTNN